jgi:hypothetical protein
LKYTSYYLGCKNGKYKETCLEAVINELRAREKLFK